MAPLKVWLLAIRPKTLVAIIAPILIGTAMASYEECFHPGIFISTLLSGLLIQILTNLANDYFDYQKGADTAARIGPTRVMQKELVSPLAMKSALLLCTLGAIASASYLIFQGGLPFALLTLLSIALAYGYTAGPFPLAYLGLGDLFVITFFGVIATSCTYFLQTGKITPLSVFIGLLVGFLCNTPLVVNNLRDEEQDRKAKKNTLIVRVGAAKGKIFLFICALLPAAGAPFVALAYGNRWMSICALPIIFLFPYELSSLSKPKDYLPLLPRFSLMILLYSIFFIAALFFPS